MNKEEFLIRIKSNNEPTERQWQDIQYVYTWHPSIDDVNGKDQIAKLWDLGGYRLIEDMMPTAKKDQELQEEIRVLEQQLSDLRRARFDLMLGGTGNV